MLNNFKKATKETFQFKNLVSKKSIKKMKMRETTKVIYRFIVNLIKYFFGKKNHIFSFNKKLKKKEDNYQENANYTEESDTEEGVIDLKKLK